MLLMPDAQHEASLGDAPLSNDRRHFWRFPSSKLECRDRIEGYTPAAPAVRLAAHPRHALRIIPTANKTGDSLLLD